MLASYNWIKEFTPTNLSVEELGHMLTMAGGEIEGIESSGVDLNGVVTARIVSKGPHPNADKLSLCRVVTSEEEGSEELTIVCGASNMESGDKVALARHGARLPGGVKIKRGKIRGERSEGMLCSEVELGLASESGGIMILPEDTPLGLDFNDTLPEGDAIFDIGVTPNRSDLLSIRGIARDVSAITSTPFSDIEAAVIEGGAPIGDHISAAIDDKELCSRYSLRVIEGIKVGPPPPEVATRLEAHGIRSINNIVDVTNYVMLEFGQPLHAFDLDKVEGGSLSVRGARDGETIKTLDGEVQTLEEGMAVIADASGPVAVAGVMGGAGTEVSESTTSIALESAWFAPRSVRRTAKRLSLGSESSYRFERTTDIESVTKALDRAAAMIADLAGGVVAGGLIDIYPEEYRGNEVRARFDRIRRILGLEISNEKIKEIICRLGLAITEENDTGLTVIPPGRRPDIAIEEDIIEEVVRIFGYDSIPADMPTSLVTPATETKGQRLCREVKSLMMGAGFTEVVNYSFVSDELDKMVAPMRGRTVEDEGVRLLNPISEEGVVMRRSLLPSLLENLKTNIALKAGSVKIFEYRPTYHGLKGHGNKGERGGGGEAVQPLERWTLGGLIYGPMREGSWAGGGGDVDFADLRGLIDYLLEGLEITGNITVKSTDSDLYHPGKSGTIKVGKNVIATIGELHPRIGGDLDISSGVYIFEVDIATLLGIYGKCKKYIPLSKFPEITRDIAFLIDHSVPWQKIFNSIKSLDTKLVEKVELFDVYCGKNIPKGKRSLAVKVVFRHSERTLKAEEVESLFDNVSKTLEEDFGAEVRR